VKPLHGSSCSSRRHAVGDLAGLAPTEHTFANVKLDSTCARVVPGDAGPDRRRDQAEADIEATRIGERLRKEGFTEARAITGDETGQVVVSGIPPRGSARPSGS